jgi:MSHA biogenesis protein MshP
MKRRQQGMSIVVALFVVVVVAMLAAFAVTVGGAQRQTNTTNLEGSRALAAARSGLEWGIYRARVNSWCNTPNVQQVVNLTEGALRGFQVTVSCRGYQHNEGGPPYYSFDITATAKYGTYGSTDFASRTVTGRYFAPGY